MCLAWCVAFLSAALPAAAQLLVTTDQRQATQGAAAAEILSAAIGPPSKVDLFDEATLRLTEKLNFVQRDVASRYLRAFNRPDPKDLVGMFVYGGRDNWFAVLRFVRDGFVDASAIRNWTTDDVLASIKAQVEDDNKERSAQGEPLLTVAGWLIPPTYDAATHSINWAASIPPVTASRERDSEAVHNIAIFGRDGYFLVEIYASAGEIRDKRGDARLFIDHLKFVDGKRYEDFRRGVDPTAHGGLDAVFGVRELRHVGLFEGQLDPDMLMIFLVGGGLTLGAGALGLARYMMYRRRYAR
ncbi:MAG: DUF2167 domain-containing protein [Acetobacteraceae bacterium]